MKKQKGVKCMQKVTYFHLDTCPYCLQADQVIEELIREQENAYDEMPELSDDQYEDLNYAVSSIRIGDDVTVKYFRNYHIRSVFGSVTKLELQKREIWIDRKRIAFEELIEITL